MIGQSGLWSKPMSCLFYEVPILDDEGNQFAEFDATLTIRVELEFGEPVIYIDNFAVDATNGKIKYFSVQDEDPIMRTLFLRAKDYLEKDNTFLDYTLSKSDEIDFVGLGPHDPDGHYIKHDPDGHYIKHDPDNYALKKDYTLKDKHFNFDPFNGNFSGTSYQGHDQLGDAYQKRPCNRQRNEVVS